MATVGICTPHGEKVSPRYYRHLLTMQSQFPQHTFTHIEVDTMIVGKARNMLAETALPYNVEVLWWIDNDVLIPPESGVLIDQALNLGVVSGVYFNRRPPYTPQVFSKATEEENFGKYWPLVDYPPGGIHQVNAVGMGCLAMQKNILPWMVEVWNEKLEQELARHDREDYLGRLISTFSPWFEFMNQKGEDFYFCERLEEACIDIYCNFDIKCAHIGEVDIMEYHFKYLIDNDLLRKVGVGAIEVQQ